jgi:hypothetical protein
MNAAPSRLLLLSANRCGTGMGSVFQIGGEWYSRLAAQVSVTLVTHIRKRECAAINGDHGGQPGSQRFQNDPAGGLANGGQAEDIGVAHVIGDFVHDLCAALRDIAGDRDGRLPRGIVGRSRAEKRYGWDANIRSGLVIYRQLLQHHPEQLASFQEGGIHA